MTLTETEIWLADIVFIIKDSKSRYVVKDQVVPKVDPKQIIADSFYMKRFMKDLSITLVKSLLKEKGFDFPIATVEFKRFISMSFVEPNQK